MDISGFDIDKAIEKGKNFDKSSLQLGGCSSVRKGNLHGRNLDFYVNEQADIIVRTAASEGTLASIGTCTCNPLILKKGIDNKIYNDEMCEIMPLTMTDGLNEKGVCINVNVVPLGECEKTSSTKPGAPQISIVNIVRLILDKAESVDNAIEILKSYDITGSNVLPFDYHWMISDAEKTVVVEIWNNEIVVTPSNFMTNFYVSNPETPFGNGHERWNILNENYDEAVDLAGMQNLMKRVWYSKYYDPNNTPRWYTEAIDQKNGITYQDVLAGNTAKLDSLIVPEMEEFGSIDKQKSLRSADNDKWYTTHSIVYDLENLSMILTAEENEGSDYSFSIKK